MNVINMDENFVLDTFILCWNAILNESEEFNISFLNEGHCNILDSRDTNFNKVESRLAYAYKFGYFNIQCVEKCISKFLVEHSESETVFPFENLKICSLSNGPGFDIVGLLCAIHNSEKCLKCFPCLKAINLYDSWQNMYKAVVKKAYEVISLQSYFEYFHITSENIYLIQGDIYSTISPEAENMISDSNVVLMVKIFVSTKASIDVFSNTLKKIFSLLKPGALVFFIGTKNNVRNFSKSTSLSSSVKCIFGPQKISLENLSFKEDWMNNMTVKPQLSGHAQFIVWQKREINITVKVKKNRKKKKEVLATVQNQADEDSIKDDLLDNTDSESEISLTSDSKRSNSLSDELESGSLENISDEINGQNLEKESHNSSVYSVLSFMEENNTSCMGLQKNEHQSLGIESNLESTLHNKETKPVIENKTQPLKPTYSKENIEEIKNETTQNKISLNIVPQSAKKCVSDEKINPDHSVTMKSITNNISQTILSPTVQSQISKEANTRNKKKSKKKIGMKIPSEENIDIRSDKNVPEVIIQSNQSENNYSGSMFNFPRNLGNMHSSSSNVQQLIQRCDSLITSLEEMVTDMKKDIPLRSNQCFMRKISYTSEECSRLRNGCCCCCANIQSYCCRKICRCNIMKNICTSCANLLPCRSNIKTTHECCFVAKGSVNISRPCLVIPLQNDHL